MHTYLLTFELSLTYNFVLYWLLVCIIFNILIIKTYKSFQDPRYDYPSHPYKSGVSRSASFPHGDHYDDPPRYMYDGGINRSTSNPEKINGKGYFSSQPPSYSQPMGYDNYHDIYNVKNGEMMTSYKLNDKGNHSKIHDKGKYTQRSRNGSHVTAGSEKSSRKISNAKIRNPKTLALMAIGLLLVLAGVSVAIYYGVTLSGQLKFIFAFIYHDFARSVFNHYKFKYWTDTPFQLFQNKKKPILKNEHLSVCASSPCLNDGKCEQTGGRNYKCFCRDGYDGAQCQTGKWYTNAMQYGTIYFKLMEPM